MFYLKVGWILRNSEPSWGSLFTVCNYVPNCKLIITHHFMCVFTYYFVIIYIICIKNTKLRNFIDISLQELNLLN